MKLHKATQRETMRIAIGVTVLTMLMHIVYLIIGKWTMAVLYGSLIGAGYAIINFFIMGLTVQKMASNPDEKKAKLQFQFSYSVRQFAMFVVAGIGLLVPFIDGVAVIIPLLFPKFVILFMQITGMYKPDKPKEELDEH